MTTSDVSAVIGTPHGPSRWTSVVLALRWVALLWMAATVVLIRDPQLPVVASVAILLAFVWTIWNTIGRVRTTTRSLIVDLGLAAVLTLVGGFASPTAQLASNHPAFVGVFPLVAIVLWSSELGTRGGSAAAALLGVALIASYILNGVDLANGSVVVLVQLFGRLGMYLLVAILVSFVAEERQALVVRIRALARNAEQLRLWLTAQVHDEVLPSLGLIRKRGRGLADAGKVAGRDVSGLMDEIAAQEAALRQILRLGPRPPAGLVSLRDTLATAVTSQDRQQPVKLMTSGWLWVPEGHARVFQGAVEEALRNVGRHAYASQVWLSAYEDDNDVVVLVHDDGEGLPAGAAHALGETFGMQTMRARVEQLGGAIDVRTRPGKGTEIEFQIPVFELLDHGDDG